MLELEPLHVIISLRLPYALGLLSGEKCVELRRRPPAIEPGTQVWLYSKAPAARVIGVGVLKKVVIAEPLQLWQRFSTCAGLAEPDFYEYFCGVQRGAALMFASISSLEEPLSLHDPRKIDPGFHPPQFFQRLRSPALISALRSSRTRVEQVGCDH